MILKSINLAITFSLEVFMLVALAFWGFKTGDYIVVRLLLGLGAPLIVIIIWAQWMAPKAPHRIKGWAYLVVKFILFGWAALGLAGIGQVILAIVFAVVSVINQVLIIAWKQSSV